jgi:uncharacterized membrane protein HdeD (DUF308 family)
MLGVIRLLLLFLGTGAVRRAWGVLVACGVSLALLGLVIFADALRGAQYFPTRVFGWVLVVEGLVVLIAALNCDGLRRRTFYVRSLVLVIVGLVTIDPHRISFVILAMLFGTAVFIDAVLRVTTALLLRFPLWKSYLMLALLELAFAIFLLEPWPMNYVATVPYCVGVWLVVSGLSLCRVGSELRVLPEHALLQALFSRGWTSLQEPPWAGPRETLTVHVWSARDVAEDPRSLPLVDRYVAAIDAKGVVAMGHAALEILPDVYVSHYPAVEIERSPGAFLTTIRATAENDVPGHFLPSYPVEVAGWCESTHRITLEGINGDRARAFWRTYRKDATYNLTKRNCSTAVVNVLETALEGAFGVPRPRWRELARALISPELWIASQLRSRGESWTWTPGLVRDYAEALSCVLRPPPVAWMTLASSAAATYRRARKGAADVLDPMERG